MSFTLDWHLFMCQRPWWICVAFSFRKWEKTVLGRCIWLYVYIYFCLFSYQIIQFAIFFGLARWKWQSYLLFKKTRYVYQKTNTKGQSVQLFHEIMGAWTGLLENRWDDENIRGYTTDKLTWKPKDGGLVQMTFPFQLGDFFGSKC